YPDAGPPAGGTSPAGRAAQPVASGPVGPGGSTSGSVRDVADAGAAAGAGAPRGDPGRPAGQRPRAARPVPGRRHVPADRPRGGRLPGAGDGRQGAGLPGGRHRPHGRGGAGAPPPPPASVTAAVLPPGGGPASGLAVRLLRGVAVAAVLPQVGPEQGSEQP